MDCVVPACVIDQLFFLTFVEIILFIKSRGDSGLCLYGTSVILIIQLKIKKPVYLKRIIVECAVRKLAIYWVCTSQQHGPLRMLFSKKQLKKSSTVLFFFYFFFLKNCNFSRKTSSFIYRKQMMLA